MHEHNNSPHSLFVLASSGIGHFQDLAGKTLATTPGNSHRNYFPIAARMAGLDPDTVSWTVVDATAMPSLLINKRVDGVPYFTSNASFVQPQAKAIGDELVVIPFADYGFDIYSYCIYARDDVIEEQPDMLRRFLKATYQSFVWARDNPEEAARLHKERWPDTKYEDNLAGWMDLSANMFGKDKSVNWTGHYNMDKVQKTYDVLVESRGLDPDFAIGDVINDSLLPPM
jgi:NitT/TauT family transport system substrate-binding protein